MSLRQRNHNFSAGPGAVPDCVLTQASQALECLPDFPLSILGISHRSTEFTDLVDELEENLRQLLGLPPEYECVFLQGGGSLQFSMIAMNFLRGQSRPAAYIDSGYWSHLAVAEARLEGPVEVVWSGEPESYTRLPTDVELDAKRDFSYLHYASNETVEGLQFFREPVCSAATPRICDMSSDFLARPLDVGRYAMIYAHAQKNLGPSGLTICVIHRSLLERCPAGLHSMLDYRNHIRMRSAYNTPPVFAIYVVLLMTRWLRNEIGGLAAMERINRSKADALYRSLAVYPDFYHCRAQQADRSLMNVAFSLPTTALEQRFVAESEAAGFYGLKGHRSVGGVRVSLYNPVTEASVSALTAFMSAFAQRHG
ncbi:MAG: 3-phosphoserine/phosphohydroxythreonine transaminase [Verrucomicrobiota bacterium]